jgi:hypothetical protein
MAAGSDGRRHATLVRLCSAMPCSESETLRHYCSFPYSAFACFRMGMSGFYIRFGPSTTTTILSTASERHKKIIKKIS